jgi:hypothetical protein
MFEIGCEFSFLVFFEEGAKKLSLFYLNNLGFSFIFIYFFDMILHGASSSEDGKPTPTLEQM